jgi:MFS family permease
VLVIVLTAVFMQLLDVTVTTVAIPSIQRSLHTTFGEVQLVLAGYSLAFACVLITGGRLGDISGRKRLFLIGMVTFTAASAVCGAAPDALTLVVARIVQGMCSGLMFPQVLAILQVTFPDREKQKAFAAYGASIGLATILGPVLGAR